MPKLLQNLNFTIPAPELLGVSRCGRQGPADGLTPHCVQVGSCVPRTFASGGSYLFSAHVAELVGEMLVHIRRCIPVASSIWQQCFQPAAFSLFQWPPLRKDVGAPRALPMAPLAALACVPRPRLPLEQQATKGWPVARVCQQLA